MLINIESEESPLKMVQGLFSRETDPLIIDTRCMAKASATQNILQHGPTPTHTNPVSERLAYHPFAPPPLGSGPGFEEIVLVYCINSR